MKYINEITISKSNYSIEIKDDEKFNGPNEERIILDLKKKGFIEIMKQYNLTFNDLVLIKANSQRNVYSPKSTLIKNRTLENFI